MKPKKKMHDQEAYELDNYLNEEEDRYYEVSSNASIWYSQENLQVINNGVEIHSLWFFSCI